jgi:hypothetical protein
VQRASGIPCALWIGEGETNLKNSGKTCGENAEAYLSFSVIPGRA